VVGSADSVGMVCFQAWVENKLRTCCSPKVSSLFGSGTAQPATYDCKLCRGMFMLGRLDT
jgi:hypothetical protein